MHFHCTVYTQRMTSIEMIYIYILFSNLFAKESNSSLIFSKLSSHHELKGLVSSRDLLN